jgi:NAD-dependent dihydropyrimidine dehydrogenase PreA subunit
MVIGKALIDKNRCLPWADGVSCIVCEEMCPLPEKAITLEVRQNLLDDGTTQELMLPQVQRDLCTGCGICENKCPKAGEAAIRINRMDLV